MNEIDVSVLRSLFVRYIKHVRECEGVDFITNGNPFGREEFTPEEWELLEKLSADSSSS